jgi:hypothetical protein
MQKLINYLKKNNIQYLPKEGGGIIIIDKWENRKVLRNYLKKLQKDGLDMYYTLKNIRGTHDYEYLIYPINEF